MLMEKTPRRYDATGAAAQSLRGPASETSNVIRQKLAAVADELRLAAATVGTGREDLLDLANKLEMNAKLGERS